ncbi:MAG: glycosyltransferase family 4 protein [Candidatus Aenigmarchaeota archaeon]|nr:glycosyltransferase family 4 protein [Candidatus Aenigmarchaeota archaeon]
MRILIISDLAPPVVMGGIENYIINLSKGLIKKGNEIHWLTSKLPNTKSEEDYEGIKIHRVYIPFSRSYMFPGRQMFFLTSLIKGVELAKKVDIVLVNTLVPGFIGWLIAKLAGKPSVLFCHEFYGGLWRSLGQNLFEKISYPAFEKFTAMGLYDAFLCPSEYSKKTLMKYGVKENKIQVIPHGTEFSETAGKIDYRKEFKLENYFLIGYIGRLGQKGTGQAKNIKGLLEAVKYVIEKLPNSKLFLAGTKFDELEPYIEELGLVENVVYAGKIPDEEKYNFLTACDVVVCPAISDGFCFLLAEAIAAGVKVVGTNCGSHPERIENYADGILTQPDSRSLADGIVKVLGNKTKSHIKVNRKPQTWSDSVNKHLELFEKLVKA